ncbi:uncharacterized membrane protein YsdA (DUF1294 family) [Sinobacterium caligoides]|uniref:Uncharacterized membrane protein YsdA (DUF1294 family) n=1 Tax=Sinobacterium caligoides TaxID=933926 RepID=A0A3N2DQ81_9GAMM|nr:DUF1294 domain-containing protein [Sinobacterium caligoides]ROS01947.1 uncharacterized membrane protein YsdA (DUF1294 family) [Sinobacterium caligoides]
MRRPTINHYALVLLPFVLSMIIYDQHSLPLVLYVVMSVCAYVQCWLDKRRAERRQSRLSERSLHFVELLGGWPGALLAQRRFRHKTRKKTYRWVVRAIVLLHALAWGLVLYRLPLFDKLLSYLGSA